MSGEKAEGAITKVAQAGSRLWRDPTPSGEAQLFVGVHLRSTQPTVVWFRPGSEAALSRLW